MSIMFMDIVLRKTELAFEFCLYIYQNICLSESQDAFFLSLCAFKSRAQLAVLCVPRQGTSQDSQQSLCSCQDGLGTPKLYLPAGKSQPNSCGLSLGAAVKNLVTNPSICRGCWAVGHLPPGAGKQNKPWRTHPKEEFSKELFLHVIFT